MYQGRRKTKLPRTNFMNLKTVEVGRGRNGYGFTVSGQSPCVLSCILHGSPAEVAGLKKGDSVMAVNGENVARLSHEQIIKLIGATTGVLRLTVAEMDYSESSDEEYVYMPRTRYPFNKRSQSATPLSMSSKPRAEMVVEDIQKGSLLDTFTSMQGQGDMPQGMLRGSEVQRIQADLSASKFAPGHLSPFNRTGKAEIMLKKSSFNYDYSYWNGKAFEKVNVPPKARKPKRHNVNDARARMFSTPTPTNSFYVQENPYDDGDPDLRPLSPVELNKLMYPGNDSNPNARERKMHRTMSVPADSSRNLPQGQSFGASVMDNVENIQMRAMVGYLGSIDIPASANLPTASLHAIRGCVRRLHKEHRVHSFMLMEIGTEGVRLINSNGRVAVVYLRERLAFSGVCPDDKRFFGIVTTQSTEEMIDAMDSDDEPIGSSCHVFMVDPEVRRHDVHARVTGQFGILCATDPETNTCDIFPTSAKPVLQCVSKLYRDHNDSSYFGEFYGQSPFVSGPRRSNSNSSNSDSGFGNGNGKEQCEFNGQGDHTQIVDVASFMRNKRGSNHGTSPYGPNTCLVQAEINTSLSSDVPYSVSSTSPLSMDTSPQNLIFRNTKDLSGRLTPRARPDPIGFRSPSVIPNQRESSHPSQQVARPASVQVPMQNRSQIVPGQIKSEQSGIASHNQKPSAESSGSSTLEDNSQRGKDAVDAPRGLPPSGRTSCHAKFDGSVPDAAIDRATARKVQDELARRLSENQFFHQKQALHVRRNSDCSEYSSSSRLPKAVIERLKQNLHQNQTQANQIETLAASDGDLNGDGKGIHGSASNPNLAGANTADDPTIGRVSSWAVDFERLLSDELGLACFTEFLKKEFSEENIMFWIACERMSKISDRKELQKTAQEIYDKHLGPKALMPVNLDSGCRSMVEEAVKNPTPEMFKIQQQQIFKLMKFDSYSRFLKSKLYQDCVLAEMGGLPLPISLQEISTDPPLTPDKDEEKNGGVVVGGTVKEKLERKKSDKKDKKKLTFGEKLDDGPDKRRISILPWKNKTKKVKDGDKKMTSSGNDDTTSASSRHSSVTSNDFRPANSMSHDDKYIDMNHCFHMIFPNNEILTLTPTPHQTVRQILLPLLEERGLTLQNVEIFLNDTKELIDLDQPASDMIGRQIVVERRVVFKIELPNRRVIGVKSKLSKKIIEVLRPVTYKYKLQLDALVVHLSESPVPLDLDITVASLDGQRILIETLEQYSAGSYNIGGRASVGPSANGKPQRPDVREHRAASVDSFLKDDDTVKADPNRIPKEKLKAQLSIPLQSILPGGDAAKTERRMTTGSTLTKPEVKHLPTSTNPRTEGRRQGNLKVSDTDDLIAMVSKVQGRRIDDQRGLTIRNLELPDFLKVSATASSSSKPTDSRPKSSLGLPFGYGMAQVQKQDQQHGELKAIDIEAMKLRPKSTPPRANAPPVDEGIFSNGIIPTNAQAEALFGDSQRSPTVRFSDTVVSSTYGETAWDSNAYLQYNPSPDKLRPLVNDSSFMNDKLSPRAYTFTKSSDSTDYGQNNTAYSFEFNSSFGSSDLPSHDITLTTASPDTSLPPAPSPDLDSTLQASVANYTPPPLLGNGNQDGTSGDPYPQKASFSSPDIRQLPTMQTFGPGCTLPGHNPDLTIQPQMDSNAVTSRAYVRSTSLPSKMSLSSNNAMTQKPTYASSVPSIQEETNNCYSNYCPIPTTPDGSFYETSPSPNPPPSWPKPDVTEVHARERVIKPPPAYHSSAGYSRVTYRSSEDLHRGVQGATNGAILGTAAAGGASTITAIGVQKDAHGTATTRMHGGIQGRIPPKVQGTVHGAVPTGPAGGMHGVAPSMVQGGVHRMAPTGAQGGSRGATPVGTQRGVRETMPSGPQGARAMKPLPAQGRPKPAASPDYQGKETVVISKDGRKLRATFV